MRNWADLLKSLAYYVDEYRFGVLVGAVAGTDIILLTAIVVRF